MKSVLLFGLSIAFLLVAQLAQADTSWNVTSGNWSTGGNWTNGEPDISTTARINNGGTSTITNSGEQCLYLFMGGGSTESGHITMNSGHLESQYTQVIGGSGSATFSQYGGTNDAFWLEIGYYTGSSGTYTLWDGVLNTGHSFVGCEGIGQFIQNGGTHQSEHWLYVPSDENGTGTYTMNDGLLSFSDIHVRYSGSSFALNGGTVITGWFVLDSGATFSQSNGTILRINELSSGFNNVPTFGGSLEFGYDGPDFSRYLYRTNNMTVGNDLVIGYDDEGTMEHSNGTVTVGQSGDYNLYVGKLFGSTGIYNMSGGANVTTKHDLEVGFSGTGTFNQTAGTHLVSEDINIAHNAGSTGTYNLSGGTLTNDSVTDLVHIGVGGTGYFNNSGGTHTANGFVYLGNVSGGFGVYKLSAGKLDVPTTGHIIVINGKFDQTGGSCDPTLYVGYDPNFEGIYSISGGTLQVDDCYIGTLGQGLFQIEDAGAEIIVSNLLKFGEYSSLTAVPDATIHMTGSDLENENPDPTALADLVNVTLVFEGGSGDIDEVEVGGRDYGPQAGMQGFTDNNAFGGIVLGGTDVGQVRFVDNFDNQPGWDGTEVLYLESLQVGAGCYVDLNGHDLYAMEVDIDPGATIEYNGGEIIEVHPGWANHDVGNCVLTMTCQGILGFTDATATEGSGFVYPAGGENNLYIGSLWVGESPTYVANRDYDGDPDKEWQVSTDPDGHVVVLEPGTQSDQDIYASYTDSAATSPLGLYVDQESWAYSSPDVADDFVIVRYRVRNDGASTLSDIYIGEFLDIDIGSYTENMGGTDISRNLAYITDISDIHVGVRLLQVDGDPVPVSNVTIIHNPTYVWPNGETGYMLDEDKHGFLSASDPEYVVHEAPELDDYSVLASAGPFTLDPGEEEQVVFAVVGGENLAELIEHSDVAQLLLNSSVSDAPEPSLDEITPSVTRLLPSAPNPFELATLIRFNLAEAGRVQLGVYDVGGRLVRRLAEGEHPAGSYALNWDGRDESGRESPSGTYFLLFEADGKRESGRLIRLR